MLGRITLLWSRLKNSMWALPMGMCLVGAAIAVVVVRVRIRPRGDPVWWLYSGDVDAASTLISNLLGAMITMATLAISITMVVLTLAAQSLGPRLIPIFMSDRRTKLVLGLYLGTVVYLLLCLRSVAGDTTGAPNLAVTVSVFLVLTCVLVLLFFVHHLARSIVADTVIERVGESLDRLASEILPVEDGEPRTVHEKRAPIFRRTGKAVNAPRAGYVQLIDYSALGRAAAEYDAEILLPARAGHLILEGEVIAWIRPSKAAEPKLVAEIVHKIILGNERTSAQDLEYSIRQLVEIALRALSPGINDPHTAIAAIDRLFISMTSLMELQSESGIVRDPEGRPRVYHSGFSFSGLLDAAFTEIRQAGAEIPAILIKLADRYAQLLALAPKRHHKAICEHMRRVHETGRRTVKNSFDRKALFERLRNPSG